MRVSGVSTMLYFVLVTSSLADFVPTEQCDVVGCDGSKKLPQLDACCQAANRIPVGLCTLDEEGKGKASCQEELGKPPHRSTVPLAGALVTSLTSGLKKVVDALLGGRKV